MSSIIDVQSLAKSFGGVTAVNGASFEIPEGSIVGLIGPNGSGKTTTLNLLNGVISPDSGSIKVDGAELAGKSSTALVKAGVTRTFQNARVFSTITAIENLLADSSLAQVTTYTSVAPTSSGTAPAGDILTAMFLRGGESEEQTRSLLKVAANTCYVHRAMGVEVEMTTDVSSERV